MIKRLGTGLVLFSIALGAGAQMTDDEQSFEGTIMRIEEISCENTEGACRQLTVMPDDPAFGTDAIGIEVSPGDALGGNMPQYKEGQHVIIQTQVVNGQRQYFVSDIVRRPVLAWLCILFIAAVILFGGFAAVRSFLGMIISFAVLLAFILPRILAGDSPVLIALMGSSAIMVITFIVCHGWNRKMLAALGGTGASLLVTAFLAYAFSVYATLTGSADEEMLFLLADFPLLDTRGILLAGIIIGSLGVLDDVTIAQASAVFELRKANALMTVKQLYTSAYRIGADHIAAAVNTLVLAYAGTALPLLLLVVGVSAGESWYTFINREMIAQEIVRTLVGSIGLLAAVPLTTIFAVLLAVRTPSSTIAAGRGHTH
jgi:uncharacterized membrane protein